MPLRNCQYLKNTKEILKTFHFGEKKKSRSKKKENIKKNENPPSFSLPFIFFLCMSENCVNDQFTFKRSVS